MNPPHFDQYKHVENKQRKPLLAKYVSKCDCIESRHHLRIKALFLSF